MSTSNGVSPSTSTCHPVARRSQAGSTSGVRYQLALKHKRGRPARIPVTSSFWAAMVPASTRPAAISTGWRRHGHLTLRHHFVERKRKGVRHHAHRPGERRPTVGLDAPRIEVRGITPEAHEVEDHLGGVARRHIGEFLDDETVQPALHRQQGERQCLGDEARARARAEEGRRCRVRRRPRGAPAPRGPGWPAGGTRCASTRRSHPTRADGRRRPCRPDLPCRGRSPAAGQRSLRPRGWRSRPSVPSRTVPRRPFLPLTPSRRRGRRVGGRDAR